jgi:hypothetical protein
VARFKRPSLSMTTTSVPKKENAFSMPRPGSSYATTIIFRLGYKPTVRIFSFPVDHRESRNCLQSVRLRRNGEQRRGGRWCRAAARDDDSWQSRLRIERALPQTRWAGACFGFTDGYQGSGAEGNTHTVARAASRMPARSPCGVAFFPVRILTGSALSFALLILGEEPMTVLGVRRRAWRRIRAANNVRGRAHCRRGDRLLRPAR